MNDEIKLTIPTVPVTEEEKQEFYKCFLSDTPYTGIEKLFDGQYTIEYRSLTVQQSADVFEQLRKDQLQMEISSDANYMMALTNYRLGQAIVKINDVPFIPDITRELYEVEDKSETYIKAKAAILKTWHVFKLSALAEGLKAFEDKMVYMTKEINTPNFWKAAQPLS